MKKTERHYRRSVRHFPFRTGRAAANWGGAPGDRSRYGLRIGSGGQTNAPEWTLTPKPQIQEPNSLA